VAPEVAMKLPYNQRADCYSFALLFQEILALKNTAFHSYAPREYFQKVVKGSERPAVGRTWPKLSKQAMKDSWNSNPERRPTMKQIAKMIRGDLNEMSEDEEVVNRTKHMKERSTRSLKGSEHFQQQTGAGETGV
jgi:hypothetical protein